VSCPLLIRSSIQDSSAHPSFTRPHDTEQIKQGSVLLISICLVLYLSFLFYYSVLLSSFSKLAKSGSRVAEGQHGVGCQAAQLFLSCRQAQISVSNRCTSCHCHVQLVLNQNEHLKKALCFFLLRLCLVFHYSLSRILFIFSPPATDLVAPIFCHYLTCFKSGELSHVHH